MDAVVRPSSASLTHGEETATLHMGADEHPPVHFVSESTNGVHTSATRHIEYVARRTASHTHRSDDDQILFNPCIDTAVLFASLTRLVRRHEPSCHLLRK